MASFVEKQNKAEFKVMVCAAVWTAGTGREGGREGGRSVPSHTTKAGVHMAQSLGGKTGDTRDTRVKAGSNSMVQR